MLVDTSVWIELLSPKPRRRPRETELLRFVTCGPVIQEVLQGLRPGPRSEEFRELFLALPVVSDPIPLTLFLSASDIYRHGRSKGFTIRSSLDCLIAAVAIENRIPVLHRDRDFDAIARFTRLQVAAHPG
jgi:predicted nucleic acid-binding protein